MIRGQEAEEDLEEDAEAKANQELLRDNLFWKFLTSDTGGGFCWQGDKSEQKHGQCQHVSTQRALRTKCIKIVGTRT